jgi:hypothetical protein
LSKVGPTVVASRKSNRELTFENISPDRQGNA